jgi:uncharacterized membrane protein
MTLPHWLAVFALGYAIGNIGAIPFLLWYGKAVREYTLTQVAKLIEGGWSPRG